MSNPWPSMKGRELVALLMREPLGYRVKRRKGSHRRMVSDNGYPSLTLAVHEGATVGGGAVKKVLTRDVGLDETQAKEILNP